jgi:very-short-patch-repair endonuclease
LGTYREGDSSRARRLRSKMTDAEAKLWSILRNRNMDGHKFVRQVPIGPYVSDFACREGNLVVEVDGGQHNESTTDVVRTTELAKHGYRVIRFWNNDVLTNLEGVYDVISRELGKAPSPDRFAVDLSPEGRGDRGLTR